jgi:hypothetical protein
MLGYLYKKIEQIADTLIEPLVEQVIKARWWVRLSVLLLVLIVIGLLLYREAVPGWVTFAKYYYRVRGQNSVVSSLNQSDQQMLGNAIGESTTLLRNKLDQKGSNEFMNAWTSAQLMVALRGRSDLDTQDLANYIDQQMYRDCNCWREFANSNPHIAATAWMLIAVTRIGMRENDEFLTFLLRNKKPDGWWPIFPAEERPENASTYATAMAILALKEHLDNGLVKPQNQREVANALSGGKAWLLATQSPGEARWFDYPNVSEKKKSLSISGLVLHVLHRLDPNLNPVFDQLWLQSLPETLPVPSTFEISAHAVRIDATGTVAVDHVRYYITPWIIIGTVDAFKNGTATEKVRAITAVSQILQNMHEFQRDALQFPWVGAEFLISLRYLRGESVV